MIVFGIPIHARQIVYTVGDVIIILLALYLGHLVRFSHGHVEVTLLAILDVTTGASVFFAAIHLVVLYLADCYNPKHDYTRFHHLLRLWSAALVAFIIQMAAYYAAPNWSFGRGVTLLGFAGFTLGVTAWRYGMARFVPVSVTPIRTAIVGAGRAGKAIADAILDVPESRAGNALVGFLDDSRTTSPLAELPLLGTCDELPRVVEDQRIGRIVVAIRGKIRQELTEQLLALKAEGTDIIDMPSMYKRITGRVPIEHLADTWLIFSNGFSRHDLMRNHVLRLADITLAVIGLVLAAPIMLGAAIAVKLTSKGPAIYAQERVGINEHQFVLYKFRTMVTDAEAKTGAVWSQGAADPRVTPVGRFLRRSRIDELPQLWNVLRGDMAFVGPRPERMHFVCQLREQIPFYTLRFSVKPGVTGWAQVKFRYGSTVEHAARKLEYELYAIQEASVALYLLIILKTVQTVLLRPGS